MTTYLSMSACVGYAQNDPFRMYARFGDIDLVREGNRKTITQMSRMIWFDNEKELFEFLGPIFDVATLDDFAWVHNHESEPVHVEIPMS